MSAIRISFAVALALAAIAPCVQVQANSPQLIDPQLIDVVPLESNPQTTLESAVTDTYVDLLAELPAGFALTYRDSRSVQQEFDWFLRHPDYLDRVFKRARPYLPHIIAEISARDMPMELALLPVVESAFDPFAYSHGQAAGLWQFIPGTAKRFRVQQDWWYDGRRDLLDSTRAALEYLQRLHKMFDGDWLLAIAAYNSGEGKVRRAQRRAAPGASFWELALPRETRAYVPRLLALSRVVASPLDFGLVLPPVPDTPQFELVETGGQIDLALAAKLAGISIDELYRLNPALNRWATPPHGPHRLLVPVASAELFRHELAQLPSNQRVAWKRYRINTGDTLSTIAASHHTTVTALRQANNLRGSQIRAGKYLLIPTAGGAAGDYTLSADARQARKLSSAQSATRYRVRPGDSLWTIARAHGVSVRSLASWNGMAPRDTLRTGRVLVIRDGKSKSTAPTSASLSADTVSSSATQRRINYTVRNGDSLARISSKFRVSVAQLRRWNSSVANQKYLYPGQKLVMYIDVRNQSGG